LFTRTLIK